MHLGASEGLVAALRQEGAAMGLLLGEVGAKVWWWMGGAGATDEPPAVPWSAKVAIGCHDAQVLSGGPRGPTAEHVRCAVGPRVSQAYGGGGGGHAGGQG